MPTSPHLVMWKQFKGKQLQKNIRQPFKNMILGRLFLDIRKLLGGWVTIVLFLFTEENSVRNTLKGFKIHYLGVMDLMGDFNFLLFTAFLKLSTIFFFFTILLRNKREKYDRLPAS